MNLVNYLETLFEQHGYWVIFLGLLLEFIALPFPGETTMAYAGFLSYKGMLHWQLLIICAFWGTTLGMTITYWIGRKAGMPFIRKFGKWVLLPPHKLDKTRYWFDRYGSSLVFIGYFIPGVRHVTGYFSGIIGLPFRKFALYAYSGALVWTALFIGIGKLFGPQWNHMFELAAKSTLFLAIGIFAIIALIILYRYRKSPRKLYRRRQHSRELESQAEVKAKATNSRS
ncbi:DedA family protein [Paenibacillus sp. CAA11]|uniref:DedA family protein n=1 Tax=Paenibacillus sp. CAA11 TaxID=1532905 RepID=UPI000D3557F3|nr:DedA family protein [Paenibacillus sp. CAA11]AWB43368.1 DedA family protein [Paenibacillus sp. CAA11]